MFCVFINNPPAAMNFSDRHLFANDLKTWSMKNIWLKIQADLDAVGNWVKDNKMTLAMERCFKLTFRGDVSKIFLQGVALDSTPSIKELRI